MSERKSNICLKGSSMSFGKPNLNRSSQPSMYQLLSWADPKEFSYRKKNKIVEQCPVSKSMMMENLQPKQKQNQEKQQCDQKQEVCNQKAAQYRNDEQQKSLTQTNWMKKKTLKPHNIKPQLYMYNQLYLRRSKSQEKLELDEKPKKSKKKVIERPPPTILNKDNEKDREIIKQRQQRIKQFMITTRDLPNSAFTTYFGKPAFALYGRCNSQNKMHLKTHNVMPHCGENHPQTEQTYSSALIKGRKIVNSNNLPRKPIQTNFTFATKQKINDNNSQIINLPLQKPDLVNHVRFSDKVPDLSKNVPVPKVSRNTAKKQLNKKYTLTIGNNNTNKTKKKSKKNKKNVEMNDGLKYMNIRENVKELLENKKLNKSKLAYKVTECYPVESEEGVAGKKYERIDSAKELIYWL